MALLLQPERIAMANIPTVKQMLPLLPTAYDRVVLDGRMVLAITVFNTITMV